MKLIIAAAAAPLFAAPAIAGPYVEIENNAAFIGGEYTAAQTDFHVGYTDEISDGVAFYVQAGPALVHLDGEDTETEISGKAGIEADIDENWSAYGEVSFLTDDTFEEDTNFGTKVGVRYTF